MMRAMNDPTHIESPRLPWYRRLVARTPDGRRLRRRLFVLLVVATLPLTVRAIFGWDPQKIARVFGYRIKSECHHGRDCDMPCEHAHAVCLRAKHVDDPLFGICRCPLREEVEARRALYVPPTCLDPVPINDDGDHLEWRCRGGSALPDASTDPPPEKRGTPPP
jgi:hypothetical protein